MNKYTGISEEAKNNFINQAGTKVSSKLIFTSENETGENVTLFDAINVNWEGYELGNDFENGGKLTYSGDLISYITSSYSHILEKLDNIPGSSEYDEPFGVRWINVPLYKYVNDDSDLTPPFVDENNINNVNYFKNAGSSNNNWTHNKNLNADTDYVMTSSYLAGFESSGSFYKWSIPVGDVVLENNITRKNVSLYKVSNNKSSEQPPFVDNNNVSNSSYFDLGTAQNNYWSTIKTNTEATGDYVWMSSYIQTNNIYGTFISWNTPVSSPFRLNGEDGIHGGTIYYEERFGLFAEGTTPETPSNNALTVNVDDSTWKLIPPNNSDASMVLWKTQRPVSCVLDNNDVTNREYLNGSSWSTPTRITGKNGEANPIQPVLKYQWHNSNTNAPSCDVTNQNPGNNWQESPNSPSGNNKYLWMIQGQCHNGSMIDIDSSNTVTYWTAPVCLSGADGQPGRDGDDLEFIYHIYSTVPTFGDNDDNPNYWSANSQDDYLGPEEHEWLDHPSGVTLLNKYEYCAYRRKTGESGQKTWGKFSTPFPWSIYGENGIDGDGVEYIFTTTANNTMPSYPVINSSNYNDSQQSEWGVGESNGNSSGNGDSTWHDDPQTLNNEYQKFQWVSTRKYRFPKINETTLGGQTLDHNKKYWFDYSVPQLWNWFVNDGTNPDKYVMIFTRTSSSEVAPTSPNTSLTGWSESPGNNTSSIGDEFLWMSAQYVEYNKTYDTTTRKNWSAPVCLTGDPGNDGEDGLNIEFIYFRTAEDNKVFNTGWDNFGGDNTQSNWPFVEGVNNYGTFNDGEDTGISYVGTLVNGKHADVWTDNPLGISSEYDYEYASIRRKDAGINTNWGNFCKPFLWAKFGEDGVDGDGIEYIFYCPTSTELINEQTWNEDITILNPVNWDVTTSDFQTSEYTGPSGSSWDDDPQTVDETHKYEYVSVRKKRKITETNKSEFDSSWTSGNTFTKNGNTYHINDMVWFPFSTPKLWSNFAKDGLATNLILTSDNDNITIGIDSQGLANNNYQDTTTFKLVYNTVELERNKYTLTINNPDPSLFDLNNNVLSFKTGTGFTDNFATLNNNNVLSVNIPKRFNIGQYQNILSILLTATITVDNIEGVNQNTEVSFALKITGIELTLNDIYKIWADKAILKKDNNGICNINVGIQSLTSNVIINGSSTANWPTNVYMISNNNLSGNNNIKTIIDSKNECNLALSNVETSYTFTLYYNENVVDRPTVNDIINNGTFLDEETIDYVTSAETYDLIIQPQVINITELDLDDTITISTHVIRYHDNMVEELDFSNLGNYNLSLKLVTYYNIGDITYTDIVDEDGIIGIDDIDVNRFNIKNFTVQLLMGIEPNKTIIKEKTIEIIKNGSNGSNGSSPLTFEIFNDNWQLAVNNDKNVILAGNNITSSFKIFSGSSDITNDIEITQVIKSQTPISNYVNVDINNYTITFINNENINLNGYVLDRQLSQGLEIIFTYNGSTYRLIDYISVVNIPCDGEDGSSIEYFELFTDTLTIKENTLTDSIEYIPTSLDIKLRHIYNGTSEILTLSEARSLYDDRHINIWYRYDNNTWTEYGLGVNITGSPEIDAITIRLYYDETDEEMNNKDYDKFMDSETVHILRDGIDGTDSYAEEFIYYCPPRLTEIDWAENTDDNLDPRNWAAVNEPDYIYNPDNLPLWWQDHPAGVDEVHPYEYVAHRSYDKDNKHWNVYDSVVTWSHWGTEGRDGDGVEYIYRITNEEIDLTTEDISLNPTSWSNDDDYQTNEYIKKIVDPNDPHRFYLNYFTTCPKGNGEITFTIPASVNRTYITSISYRKNKGEWITTPNSSSEVIITVSDLKNGDIIEWKGTADNFAVSISNTLYNSKFSSTVNYEVYGNIFSLIYGDDFKDKNEIVSKKLYIFAGLFEGSSNLISAENLILPAINLGVISDNWGTRNNHIYYKMFSGCTSLEYPPSELPSRSVGAYCYASMFYNCTMLQKCPTMYIESVAVASCGSMFAGCSSLTENIPTHIGIIDTIGTSSTVYYYQSCMYMFDGCTSITTAPIFCGKIPGDNELPDGVNYNTLHLGGAFRGCTNLQTCTLYIIGDLGTSTLSGFFESCKSLSEINIYFSGDYSSNTAPLNRWLANCGTLSERNINNYGYNNQRATFKVDDISGIPSNAYGWKLNNAPTDNPIPEFPTYPAYAPVISSNLYIMIWTDNPSGVSLENQYEYVSVRKYQLPSLEIYNRIIKNVTNDDSVELNESLYTSLIEDNMTYEDIVNNPIYSFYTWLLDPQVEIIIRSITSNKDDINAKKKIWMPYSQPTLWAKYGEDGSTGDSIRTALIYTWTNSRENSPSVPVDGTISSPWSEHPGNASGNNKYLWMSQGKELNGTFIVWDTDDDTSTQDTYWTAPVCLSGADGQPGSDGKDIEFIYRLYDTEPPFRSDDVRQYNNPYTWDTTSEEFQSSDYLGESEPNYDWAVSTELPLWTDTPSGISERYSYEYISIRTKENDTWQQFSLPVIWSKWGEDGMDGDGIEYIYYLSSLEIADWNEMSDENNPPIWSTNDTSSHPSSGQDNHVNPQDDEYVGPSGSDWTDDPSGVTASNQYEYVSTRKGHQGNWGAFTTPTLWARYGKDGAASSITMDNNNENIAVIIDNNNIMSSDNSIIEYSKIYMYDNLEKVDFSLTGPGAPFIDGGQLPGRGSTMSPNSYYWDSADKSYTVGFRFDPGQSIDNGRLTYTFNGTCQKNSSSIVRSTIIKIIGIHESDVPTLYQLKPTADIVKYADNSYDPVTIYTYVSYIENGENQIMKKYDTSRFGQGKLSLWANNIPLNFSTNADLQISTNDYANNFPINLELKYNDILIDSESIPCIQDGEKGDDGAAAVNIEFTNTQVNLAVNENGQINASSNQSKTTTLNIISNDTYTITNVQYTNPSQNDISISDSMPVAGITKIHIRYTNNLNKVIFNITTSQSCTASIPENGYDIPFTFTLQKQGSTNTISITKVLKICGQHIAQNAVQYDLIPSSSAIVKTSSSVFNPQTLTLNIVKRAGNDTSQISLSQLQQDGMQISYHTFDTLNGYDHTTKYIYSGAISLNNCRGGYPIDGNVTCYIHSSSETNDNNIVSALTIPLLAEGTQGLTGPIIRYRGIYDGWHSFYSDGAADLNYKDSDGPRYKDIVFNTNYGSAEEKNKYYVCIGHTAYVNSTSEVNSKNATIHTGWVGNQDNNNHNIKIGDSDDYWKNYWEEAAQFDFVATKLLYADQALINQLTTHEMVATDTSGYPVAGITSGSKAQGQNGTLMSSLDPNNNSTIGSTVYNSEDTNATQNDPSNVRIFAGNIYDSIENSYSLTYAPFNVRQDGTAYMSKANIVGDVNIGGYVNIGGNVNIAGTNVSVAGDIAVNTLTLGVDSFKYNENVELPSFNDNECKLIYIMHYNSNNRIITPDSTSYIWSAAENDGLYTAEEPGQGIELPDKKLYMLYSGKGKNPNNNITQKFWLVTQSDLFVKKITTWQPSASITNTITNGITVETATFSNANDGNSNTEYLFVKIKLPDNCNIVYKDYSAYNQDYSNVQYGTSVGDYASIDIELKSVYNGHNIEFRTVDKHNNNIVGVSNIELGSNTVILDKSDTSMWDGAGNFYLGTIPSYNLSSIDPTSLNIYFKSQSEEAMIKTTWQVKGFNGSTQWQDINQDSLSMQIDTFLKNVIQVNSVSITLYKL